MKKQFLIGIICALGACLTGCNNVTVSNDCAYHTHTLNLTVLQKDWKFDQTGLRFFYSFDVPELTDSVYNYGNWSVSREYNEGTKNAYQVALPMSVFCTDTLSNGNLVYYTQYIDYAVGTGWVEVSLQNSDHLYPTDKYNNPVKPESMVFRLQIIY